MASFKYKPEIKKNKQTNKHSEIAAAATTIALQEYIIRTHAADLYVIQGETELFERHRIFFNALS